MCAILSEPFQPSPAACSCDDSLFDARFATNKPTYRTVYNVAGPGTADLCDKFHPQSVDEMTERSVQLAQPLFRDFGGRLRFSGKVSTVKVVRERCHAPTVQVNMRQLLSARTNQGIVVIP